MFIQYGQLSSILFSGRVAKLGTHVGNECLEILQCQVIQVIGVELERLLRGKVALDMP